ncbi:MAG: Mrp/NBP35 family ATP-binding protein [Cyanobacteria bacterium P01_E01_bin.34]
MVEHASPIRLQQSPVESEQSSGDVVQLEREREAIAALKTILEPTLGKDIVSLGMVRNLRIVDDYVSVRLYIGTHQFELESTVLTVLNSLAWCKKGYVQRCSIPGVRTTIAVSSGKGGVGKSTTAVNLAVALSLQGAKVGLLDADVYGPNVPHMLGLGHADVEVFDTPDGQRFRPLEAHGIKVMSVGLLAEPDHPLAWRGPVLHKIVTQFIHDVEWGDLDYLLIDLPPGTGDAQITIVQESPICGVVLVTTPQQVALSDVRRSIHMFRNVGVPVLGIVENMSYLKQDSGEHLFVFGAGGGERLSRELNAPLMGKVPLDPNICSQGDRGKPLPLLDEHSDISLVFGQIASGVIQTFGLDDERSRNVASKHILNLS